MQDKCFTTESHLELNRKTLEKKTKPKIYTWVVCVYTCIGFIRVAYGCASTSLNSVSNGKSKNPIAVQSVRLDVSANL